MNRALLSVLIVVLFQIAVSGVAADHPDYRYKWPWFHTSGVSVTGVPYTAHHGCPAGGGKSCTDAFDFVIGDDRVVSAAQAIVFEQMNDEPECGPLLGLGNYARVWVPGGPDVIYAHMEYGSVVDMNTALLQGDQVGDQGATGNVSPCPGGEHLHFEFPQGNPQNPAHPDRIDGETTVPLQGPHSTNSVIGSYSTAGATLREEYIDRGGWGTVGWTHEHCPGACTLNMALNRSWGWMQDFRAHEDWWGGEFQTLHVSKWRQTRGYLVDTVFWNEWASGGLTLDPYTLRLPMSMALQDRALSCPAGSDPDCLSYQRFHLGFVWMGQLAYQESVFCPDIGDGSGASYNDIDNNVDLTDVLELLARFGSNDPWLDVSGDEPYVVVDLTDAMITLNEFGQTCYPL